MELRPWFETEDYKNHPNYASAAESARARIDLFREDGYLIVEDPGLGEALIDEAVSSLQGRYTGSATGYSGGGRIQDAWKTMDAVKRIATAPRVLEILRELYGKDAVPFQTLNFERGTRQRAHSDTVHFNTLPHGFMCGVWVALEDTDAENGPLFYYPGSQRLPVYHMEDLGLSPGAASYPGYEDRIGRILAESPYRPKQAHLRKGQALIWSSNIFHGGSAIVDASRTRKSQVTHFYFPGCVYYTPLLSDPANNRWEIRQVENILTGEVAPRYAGLRSDAAGEGFARRMFRKLLGR